MAITKTRRVRNCYFECEDCGAVKIAPLSDVKQAGHPVCPDECGNEKMSEITYNEYRKQKKLVTEKPFVDVDGNRYGAELKYYQPTDMAGIDSLPNDKDGNQYFSFQVWMDRAKCVKLFPEAKIMEYSGAEIEEPQFMDGTPE